LEAQQTEICFLFPNLTLTTNIRESSLKQPVSGEFGGLLRKLPFGATRKKGKQNKRKSQPAKTAAAIAAAVFFGKPTNNIKFVDNEYKIEKR
jgi:hypothetical protein